MTPGSIVDLLDLDRTDQPSAGQAMAPQAPFVGRPLLTEGLVRRRRAWGTDEAEVLVRQGDQVSAGQAVARLRRPGRATALDAAAILGLSPERVESSLLCAVGDMLAEGDVLAERRALAGLQRRVLRSPASGRLSYVSPAHGTLFIQPQAVESAVIAHLSGEVVAAGAAGVMVEGPALSVAGVAGAGRAAAGKLYLAESPTELPSEPGGAIVCCAFVLDEGTVVAMAEAGAVGILAPGIADATIQRLGWDDLLWTAARLERGERWASHPAPPLTVVLLASGPNDAPSELREALRPHAGRLASLVGVEPGIAPELLISLADGLPVPVGNAAGTGAQRTMELTAGTRVRVLAGRSQGLSGELVGTPDSPYRLASEIMTEVADVRLAHGTVIRVPIAHLQVIP